MGGSQAWSSQVIIANKVIIEGANDFLLVYAGTPALGNLIVSLASQAGVDSFGNAYPQGISVTTGVISGTEFLGTDFILNPQGAFFYDGTPALHNMIASIAPVAGVDSLGNHFVAGPAAYDTGGDTDLAAYTVLAKNAINFGTATANVPDPLADASFVAGSGGQLNAVSGIDPTRATATADGAQFTLLSGTVSTGTGVAAGPHILYTDVFGTSNSDFWIAGNMVRTDTGGVPLTKQVPGSAPVALNANWTVGAAAIRNTNPLRVWIDTNDTLHLVGAVATLNATPGNTVATLSAPYRPVNNATFGLPQGMLYQMTSAGAFKAVGHCFLTAATGVLSVNNVTFASGDIFVFDHHWPLGNLP